MTPNLSSDLERKPLLSTLWLVMLLNVLFRDFHDLFRPGTVAELMAGVVNGTEITEGLMLVGGIMIELPILMVLLARVLPYGPNRWANIVLAPLTIVITLQNGVRDLDDIFFVTVQVVVLLSIVWLAWRWRKAERGPARPNLA